MTSSPQTVSRARAGFTLIELLVVIAIIAILAGILFPVFAKARERGKQATCVSNLKQLGTAAQMYADDSEGYLPFGHTVTPGYGPPARPTYWFSAMEPLLASREVVKCPSDPDVRDFLPARTDEANEKYESPSAEKDAVYTSYVINGSFTDVVSGRRTGLHALHHPADTVLFSERNTKRLSTLGWSDDDDYHPWESQEYWFNDPATGLDAAIARTRHHDGADYLYADGHTQWRHPEETYTTTGLNQHLP